MVKFLIFRYEYLLQVLDNVQYHRKSIRLGIWLYENCIASSLQLSCNSDHLGTGTIIGHTTSGWMESLFTGAQWIEVYTLNDVRSRIKILNKFPLPSLSNENYKYTFFSCSPSWGHPESMSFIIYIFMIGYIVPHIIIVFTSVQVLNIHKEVKMYLIFPAGDVVEILRYK